MGGGALNLGSVGFQEMWGVPELIHSNTSLLDLYHLKGGGHQINDIWTFMEEVVTLKFPGGSGKLNFQEEVVNLVNEIFDEKHVF